MTIKDLLNRFPDYQIYSTNLHEDEPVTNIGLVGLPEVHCNGLHHKMNGLFIETLKTYQSQILVLVEGHAYGQTIDQKFIQSKYIPANVEVDGWDTEAVGKISHLGAKLYSEIKPNQLEALNSSYKVLKEKLEEKKNSDEVQLPTDSPKTRLRKIFQRMHQTLDSFQKTFEATNSIISIEEQVLGSEVSKKIDDSAWEDYESRTHAMTINSQKGLKRANLVVIDAGGAHLEREGNTKTDEFFHWVQNIKHLILKQKSYF